MSFRRYTPVLPRQHIPSDSTVASLNPNDYLPEMYVNHHNPWIFLDLIESTVVLQNVSDHIYLVLYVFDNSISYEEFGHIDEIAPLGTFHVLTIDRELFRSKHNRYNELRNLIFDLFPHMNRSFAEHTVVGDYQESQCLINDEEDGEVVCVMSSALSRFVKEVIAYD